MKTVLIELARKYTPIRRHVQTRYKKAVPILSPTDLQFELMHFDRYHFEYGQLLDQLSRLRALQVALLYVPACSFQVQTLHVAALNRPQTVRLSHTNRIHVLIHCDYNTDKQYHVNDWGLKKKKTLHVTNGEINTLACSYEPISNHHQNFRLNCELHS